jgi:hypothetical protein
MPDVLLAVPWWLLAAGMFVDEFYFHYKRGLPRWERIGHPVDTAGVLACFAVALFAPPTAGWLRVYFVLAVASCLLITKDEAVHAERCGAGESWLHAVLFILHPLALISAALAWRSPEGSFLKAALRFQSGLAALFFGYQAVYWNVLCREPIPASTTSSTTS